MNQSTNGNLSVIGMKGCESFVDQVDRWLQEWRVSGSFIAQTDLIRFGNGEAKGIIEDSLRGNDVYIISDCFNYGVTYKMYGQEVPYSPDDHFQDIKRVISGIAGKAKRITVIMNMLYESRQDKRVYRESLDCALALQELERMGVANIITFDAHDTSVQNAVPLCGFDSVRPAYQMIKALIREFPGIVINKDNVMMISPDSGGMARCMYYSSVLQLELGMFYKRRNFSVIVDGRNPIEAHEYLGNSLEGKDVIIVDDIIHSGDSIIEAAEKLKERGARRIFVFITFGLFCGGLERFDLAYEKGLFDKIFTTNLIYRTPELIARPWYADVNMCKYTAHIIDTLNRDATISQLLNPTTRINNYIDQKVREGEVVV